MKEQVIERTLPPRHQKLQPRIELVMVPSPQSHADRCVDSGMLEGKVALITRGDSAIGRAVAVAFAKEGADVAFIYLEERGEAMKTADAVEAVGRQCLRIAANVGDEALCRDAIQDVMARFGRLDILVNNAAEQQPAEKLEDLTEAQLLRTFQSNVFSTFYLTKAALPYLKKGARVINTVSAAAYRGSSDLLDSATKGAIVAFTRSLSLALTDRGIFVNAVASGPVWTPSIASTLEPAKVAQFGADTAGQRRSVPDEITRCYLSLAGADSSYISGQVLYPNGEISHG